MGRLPTWTAGRRIGPAGGRRNGVDGEQASERRLPAAYLTATPRRATQSGERVRGRANLLGYTSSFPGGVGTVDPTSARLVGSEDRWVLTPTFAPLRIEGSGDVYTYVGTVTYANGETWQMIQIVELHQGKIAKTTSWFAAPFEAPEWRAQFVERFPALGAKDTPGR